METCQWIQIGNFFLSSQTPQWHYAARYKDVFNLPEKFPKSFLLVTKMDDQNPLLPDHNDSQHVSAIGEWWFYTGGLKLSQTMR